MLLSDARVQDRLKKYECAWESVRDVPRVTVDFGDKRITRTLKGNTVMYVCLPDGTVIDAFPGLYTPEDFLAELDRTERLIDVLERTPGSKRPSVIQGWHQRLSQNLVAQAPPAEIIVGKAVVEAPVLNALDLESSPEVKGSGPARFQRYTATLTDASARPASGAEMSQKLAGRDAVQVDSRISVTRLRPAVHLLLADLSAARPNDCRQPLFQGLLKIPLDDPYLGLGSLMQGTPDEP